MLGSHNTLTYNKIRGWRKLLTPWSKCQEVDYKKQYELGVRYFDIRIKFINNLPVAVHNKNVYKFGHTELDEMFSWMNEKEDCYFRIVLDIRKTPKDADKQGDLFEKYIANIEGKYPNINIDEALIAWDYTHTRLDREHKYIYEKHASVTSNWEVIKTPKHYAKQHNGSIRYSYKATLKSDNSALLIDFVNI